MALNSLHSHFIYMDLGNCYAEQLALHCVTCYSVLQLTSNTMENMRVFMTV